MPHFNFPKGKESFIIADPHFEHKKRSKIRTSRQTTVLQISALCESLYRKAPTGSLFGECHFIAESLLIVNKCFHGAPTIERALLTSLFIDPRRKLMASSYS